MMKTVIIPTLNEVENITKLIHCIYSYNPPEDLHIIVVDDDSKDGTQASVEQLMQQYPNLQLVVRKGAKGLSTAVREGATRVPSGHIVVMDADFSHHPSFISSLFTKLDLGYDIVVGSRYVQGGKIIGWPASRIIVSKVATMMARILLQLKISDPMSGFVAVSSPSLLVKYIIHADYKFLLELLVSNNSLSVAEVPVIFKDRLAGQSKLGGSTIMMYLKLLLRLVRKGRIR
ncbi:MAG: polyprenol monophosphomannose synthase [Candidatus Thorarchaeota archaeon]|jgi:dolichol-phosphate mannosyltransferase